MKYNVKTIREAGLQARWTKTSGGSPIIIARERDGDTWFAITDTMWKDADVDGILEAFRNHTVLGHFFSVSI